MENQNQELDGYSFLADEQVEKYFAEINILLLSGKHIDQRNYGLFSILEEKESYWRNFYQNLYNLNFIANYFDGHKYFYLDFFEMAKGKFSDSSRYKELTEVQTLFGLVLLDIYYKRFFDEKKIVKWSDIVTLIMESEQQATYKKIFFNNVRESNNYDEKDWDKVKRKIINVIEYFDKIGWVEKMSSQNEELIFEIRPAMNRLSKLYEEELQSFDEFVNNLKNNDTL